MIDDSGLANDIAVPLRRYCYAHLVDRPDLVRFFFMHRSSWFENQAFKLTYPMLKSRLVAGYDCTPSGARRAQSELSQAMDKYDGLLGANDYFLGESFSRIDLTFASLAVFMLMPMEYPVPWPEEMFQHKTFEWFSRFHDRPCLKHVARMYAEHRKR